MTCTAVDMETIIDLAGALLSIMLEISMGT